MAKPDKTAIRAAMLALEEAEFTTAREHYEAHLQDSFLPEGEAHERGDMALSRIAAELAHAVGEGMHGHEARLAAIRDLDFGSKREVGPGAVVALGKRRLVVAVSTRRFEVGGQSYMGISPDSPLARKMAGLAAGEGFEQNGKRFTVTSVW